MRRTLGMYARALELQVPGRYVEPGNYHVTLAFLGDMALSLVPSISDGVKAATQGIQAMSCVLDGTGHFGKDSSATVWAGIAEAARIERTAAAVRRALDKLNIGYDKKPCKPHITLARKVDVGNAELPALAATAGVLDHITVFHSTRVRGVLTYLPLATIQLG